MTLAADKFLTSLVGAKDWNPQFAQIKAWAEDGRLDHLLAVAEASTADDRTPAPEAMVRNSILDSLERTLALTPGFGQAEAALTVLLLTEAQKTREAMRDPAARRRTRRQHESDLASLLVQGQPPEVLLRLFAQHGGEAQHLELLACLVQEMVLRGRSVAGPAAEFWKRLAGSHRLGGLPLTLLPLEAAFVQFLPRNGPQGRRRTSASSAAPGPPPADPIEMQIQWAETALSAEEKAALGAATANWEAESNGMTEARLFRADVPVPPPAVTSTQALSLPLESLAGTAAHDLRLVPYSAAGAAAALFSAACTGGAYNQGLGGAYGRRAAWQAAAALAGADPAASLEDAAASVSACAWWFFTAKSAWFYDVAWDIGLLALRPDRRTLAVLAATDTD